MQPTNISTVLESLLKARTQMLAAKAAPKPAIASANMSVAIKLIDEAIDCLKNQAERDVQRGGAIAE